MTSTFEPSILRALRARRIIVAHRGLCGPGAPENSLAAIRAAVDAGADAVEVDVRCSADGTFVLAHDPGAIAATPARALRLPTLAEALAAVGDRALLNVDLKISGAEDALVDELRARDGIERAFVSTLDRASAARLKAAEPALAVTLSYPLDHGGARARAALPWLTSAVVAAMRAALPLRLPGWIRATHADALTLWHGVTSARASRAAADAGVPIIAWTVNDAACAARLRACGVRGITTDDPAGIASTFRGE